MKVLVLGASGMLGHTVMQVLGGRNNWEVHGTVRSSSQVSLLPAAMAHRLHTGIDVEQPGALEQVFAQIHPEIVINCIGLIKQQAHANDPLQAIAINALLPHRLAQLCKQTNSRLIQISTDCVFSGQAGNYRETDTADAQDLYGRSKLLGEVDGPHAVTLRTSLIGHELQSSYGLIDWFLSQKEHCKGYTQAIFSGLPTVVLARIMGDLVIPNDTLHGLYHVAAQPISKYELLKLVADVYQKRIDIEPDATLKVDRSLDASRFCHATGYTAESWPALITTMHLNPCLPTKF